MKNIGGFVIILLCLLLGTFIVTLLGLDIPGPIIGMLLLLGLLVTKTVKLATVEPAANLLTALMMLFILPGGVSLMNSFYKFVGIVPQLLIILLLSTTLAIIASGWTAEFLIWLKNRKKSGGQA
jgi:holin-like protein